MSEMDYARGYEAGYRAGLRRKDGKAAPPTAAVSLEPQDLNKRLEGLHTCLAMTRKVYLTQKDPKP